MGFLRQLLKLLVPKRLPGGVDRGQSTHSQAGAAAKPAGRGLTETPADGEQESVSIESPPVSRGFPPPETPKPKAKPRRDPYYVQVGLDFGTSYCKVVCREIFRDRAWVHLSKSPADPERPFLLPSALQFQSQTLSLAPASAHYHEGGLPHVKVALAKVAGGEFEDDSVKPFRKAAGSVNNELVKAFVVDCAVYLLGGIIAEVKEDVHERYSDFGDIDTDYMAVSLAVPVADAEKPEIAQLFHEVLQRSFFCADSLGGYPALTLAELSRLTQSMATDGDQQKLKFFVYPEVSAGVQGFVRSRVSTDGIYVFSETGAATVDQSVFILYRPKNDDPMLTYLNASVLPLGSSRIEWLAAERERDTSPARLEHWRRLKEENDGSISLRNARLELGEQLHDASWHTLGVARRKLPCVRQFDDIRVLFGGGGHTRDPYEKEVVSVFDDEDRRVHDRLFQPDVISLPMPRDLDPAEEIHRWMNRLWVAYGLSFYPVNAGREV